MKKYVVIVAIVAMVVFLMTIVTAFIAGHVVMVDRQYTYSYGDNQPIHEMVLVRTSETVKDLKGNMIDSREYNIAWDACKLPWYNVWNESGIEFR